MSWRCATSEGRDSRPSCPCERRTVEHSLTKLLLARSCNLIAQSQHDACCSNRYEGTAKTQPRPVCGSREIRKAIKCTNFPHITTLGSALAPMLVGCRPRPIRCASRTWYGSCRSPTDEQETHKRVVTNGGADAVHIAGARRRVVRFRWHLHGITHNHNA